MAYATRYEIIISRQKVSDYLTDQKYDYIYIIKTMPLKHGVWVGYILINTTNPITLFLTIITGLTDE